MKLSDVEQPSIQVNRLLRALEDHAIVSVADRQGRILYANDRFCQLAGYPREELLNNDHSMLQSGLHPPEFYRDMWKTILKGEEWDGILCNKTKDNQYYWWKTRITPVPDGTGLPGQFLCIRSEVGLSRLYEENLLKKNRLLSLLNDTAKTLLDTSHSEFEQSLKQVLGMWRKMIDADCGLLLAFSLNSGPVIVEKCEPAAWHKLATAIEDLNPEAAAFVSSDHVTTRIVDLNADHGARGGEQLAETLQQHGIQGVINVPVKTDGRVPFVLSFCCRQSDNFPLWLDQVDLLEVLSDVLSGAFLRAFQEKTLLSQRYQLEKRQNYANVGDWDMDINSQVITWSPHLFGFGDNLRQLPLQDYVSLIHPDDREQFRQYLGHCIDHFAPIDVAYRLERDGESLWVQMRGSKIIDDTQNAFVILATLIDVSRNKRNEYALIRAREVAERANSAKSEFLSSMSHELRTPLNSILGFAQLLDIDDTLSKWQRENISEIAKAGKHLLQLINDILDLSMLESGNINIILEPIDIRAFVSECIALLKPVAKQHGISLLAGELAQVDVLADKKRLKQALINLVNNAIKYNRENGQVTLKATTANNGAVNILVIDTGIGIDPAKQDELFQPFNRLGWENSGREGTGIGLCYSKKVVEMMGGTVAFQSSPGQGSTFSLEFPLAARERRAGGRGCRRAKPSDDPCILYVDAARDNVDYIRHLVGDRGNFTYQYASTVEAACDSAHRVPPDIVVLNMKNHQTNFFAEAYIKSLVNAYGSACLFGLLDATSMPYLKAYHRKYFTAICLLPIDNGALKPLIDNHLAI